MNTAELTRFFMWCTILNAVLLVFSFVMYIAMGDFIYKIHGKFFPMERKAFDLVFYSFIGLYKILVFVFCLIPWLALMIVG